MDLTFVQTSNMFGRDGAWETEFSVDQEFNLHLERESSGKIIMMQKTAGTFFDIVKDFDMKSGDVVYDYDSASFLGTKTIKIVSESAIRFASLTTSGEVTEIKSQSKEIEVTSNGTTEVTPDAGFAYLNSVKVKTNVAGSGEGGGKKVRYFNVEPVVAMGTNEAAQALFSLVGLLTVKLEGDIKAIRPLGVVSQELFPNITSAAVLEDFRGWVDEDNNINSSNVLPLLAQVGCTEITEEEFYTL